MIDLHCHSTASDGSCTPRELLQLAAKKRIAALALTDHDTTGGLAEFMESAADFPTVQAIPGIELAAEGFEGLSHSFHIVGLFLQETSPRLEKLLRDVVEWRNDRNCQIIQRLCQLGLTLTEEEVLKCSGGKIIGRPHIAQAMVARGYVNDPQSAFDRFIATGKPGYVNRRLPTCQEAIAAIHSCGGVAVWAHPFTRGNHTVTQMRRLAVELKMAGMDAIEAYYSLHTPTQIRNSLAIGKDMGLLPTGGSDYHGSRFKRLELGVGYGTLNVPDELLPPLEKRAAELRATSLEFAQK